MRILVLLRTNNATGLEFYFSFVLLYILLTFAVVQDPNISLIAVNITAVLLLLSKAVFGDLYKKQYLSICFFINFILLSLMMLYIRASGGGDQVTLVLIAVGITFSQFITMVLYHIIMKGGWSELYKSGIWNSVQIKYLAEDILTMKLPLNKNMMH